MVVLGTTFDVWSLSKVTRTSTMGGLLLGSVWRHCNESAAAAWAPFLEYWPPKLFRNQKRTLRKLLPHWNRPHHPPPSFQHQKILGFLHFANSKPHTYTIPEKHLNHSYRRLQSEALAQTIGQISTWGVLIRRNLFWGLRFSRISYGFSRFVKFGVKVWGGCRKELELGSKQTHKHEPVWNLC